MAQLLKIGKVYYSDIRVACDGIDCPTKDKPRPHFHRRRKSLSTEKQFAEEKLGNMVKIRNSIKRGEPLTDLPWYAFKERFLNYASTKNIRTYSGYKVAIEHLENAVSLASIRSLTPERLDAFSTYLSKLEEYTPATANTRMTAIKAMIKKAIQWKMLDYDSAYKEVELLPTARGRLLFYSLEEVGKLMQACRGEWLTLCYLGYYAGLRRGEMRSLRVANIDFERNRIHVEAYGEFIPKNYERRFIPMAPKLRDYLKKAINGSRWVLGDQRPSLNHMTKHFSSIVADLGLTGTLHTLRHTFGSHCAMAGIPIPTLCRYMGHSNERTTSIYMHLSPEHLDQAISRLPEIPNA